ncbi:MAG: hypothetical protein NWE78_06690 [Candidatus Bathyarchaeota archaeon]|nr:hypothetical protein [Candidatus Bathyarchaeota archaeon]
MATLKKQNKEELRRKISYTKHLRKNVAFGLILGVVLVILGQLGSSLAVFILGYAIFLACTAIISFLTALNWLYSKTYEKVQNEEERLLQIITCPRCGEATGKNRKYCQKCGKKIPAKKP